jgi:hypothetical protein
MAAVGLPMISAAFFYTRYEGGCMIPDHDLGAFVVLSVLFSAGFVWLVAEIVTPLTASLRFRYPAVGGLLVGVIAYALIGSGVWRANPADNAHDPGGVFRELMSVVWIAGFLQETGTFSEYSCGY